MAARMRTTPAELDRMLDPQDGKVHLDTLFKAATAVGRELRLELT
jgi:hypothetical protein